MAGSDDGRGSSSRSRPSVQAPDELPAPVGPVEGEVEDAVGLLVAGSCRLACIPRPASTRQSSRSATRSVIVRDSAVGRRRPASRALPPRTGLHPVRDDSADLPQPPAPQELVGVLRLASSHLDGVVVLPHRASSHIRRPRGRPGGRWGSRSPPPGSHRTFVRTPRTVLPPTDSPSRADATQEQCEEWRREARRQTWRR